MRIHEHVIHILWDLEITGFIVTDETLINDEIDPDEFIPMTEVQDSRDFDGCVYIPVLGDTNMAHAFRMACEKCGI
jgi:hypothetical protein